MDFFKSKSKFKKRDWWDYYHDDKTELEERPAHSWASYRAYYKPKFDFSVGLETRVVQLIKTITGKHLKLKSAQGWGNDEDYFYYNPEDLREASDDEILGRILHQLAKELYTEKNLIAKLNKKEPEYRHLLNSLEDNRADKQLTERYQGTFYYAQELWEARKYKDNPINLISNPISLRDWVKINYSPSVDIESYMGGKWLSNLERDINLPISEQNEVGKEYKRYLNDSKINDAWEFCFNINAFQNGEKNFDFSNDPTAENFMKALPFIDEYLKTKSFEEALKIYPEIKKYYPIPDKEQQKQMDQNMASTQGLSQSQMEMLNQNYKTREKYENEDGVDDKALIYEVFNEDGINSEQRDLVRYQELLTPHKGTVNTLFSLIKSILKDNEIKRFTKPFKRGKVDAKSMYKYLATGNLRIFKKLRDVNKKKYPMTLVVDMSGSMEGRNSTYATEGAIVMAEVLEKLGLDYEVIAYNGSVYNFKRYNQPLDRALLTTLEKPNGDNNEPEALKVVIKHILNFDPSDMYNKTVFFITDGEAYEADQVYSQIKELERKHKTRFYGIGIGNGVNETDLQRAYPTFLKVNEISQLPKELLGLLRNQFRRN